ncbi:MAG: exodeoxyribonuclease III [Beijerinckiaceae bacterium]
MALRIATWNINSVRLRLPLVERFLSEESPDVLCLQEIKCREAEFPSSALKKLGYKHIAVNAQKGHHGVAILSRLPLEAIERREFCNKGDARHVGARVNASDGRSFIVHNLYVPAGGDIPDPEQNEKFRHKLNFLDELKDVSRAWGSMDHPSIITGDLNVAPYESDVWSHKSLLKVVSHTPDETRRLIEILTRGEWVDSMRAVVPEPEKLYTWWSYRSPNWQVADKGRRLDHVWLCRKFAPSISAMRIRKDARAWDKPSDHVPVIVDLV